MSTRTAATTGIERVETDFLVRVDGDLTRPRLEAGKHTEYRWIAEDELDVLDEHRDVNDGLIRQIAEEGFAALHAIGLVTPWRYPQVRDTICSPREGSALMIGLVLAAGAGRRLRPYTDTLPKALVPVDGDTTILDIALSNLAEVGLTDVTVVVGYARRGRRAAAGRARGAVRRHAHPGAQRPGRGVEQRVLAVAGP